MDDPNFPSCLEINPSENNFGDSQVFGSNSQKSAIQKYGIAGRVWEAAYTLTAYLESADPSIEFDPPSPFPAPRGRWFSSRNDFPNSSESNPCTDLDFDVGDCPKTLTVLELGSGTGIITAKLAEILNKDANGAPTGTDDILIATDLENVCPLLEQNLASIARTFWKIDQPSLRILVRPLEWGIHDYTLKILNELDSMPLTYILCSDLVYFPHLLAPLLRTLIQLTSLPPPLPQPSIIMSYRIISLPKETPFWSAFGLWFSYKPVLYRHCRTTPLSPQDNSNRDTDLPPLNTNSNGGSGWARYHSPSSTYIFVAHRKSASIGWSVPEDDKDLLEGVGAHGDQRRKGDDTFDLMLLMGLADGED